MTQKEIVKGYKVFDSEWMCRDKQYTCPGNFEEGITPKACIIGMHFCRKAADCFSYYRFDPKFKVAEVIAYGIVDEMEDKCCTDKLEIVREIPWAELLEMVNMGRNCCGFKNSGNYNSGNYNSGNWNSGNWNSGNYNSGFYNSGNWNSGNYNSGFHNSGNWNSGNYNSGFYNSGNHNSGDRNSGDWNKTFFSNGCFNTKESPIYLFNKLSDWTYGDWLNSAACNLMRGINTNTLDWISSNRMTNDEKKAHPEHETTGGYLKSLNTSDCCTIWWRNLSNKEKSIIKAIPNFDAEIFKEITGVDVTID